jgi:membrane protease YdiL (CAAX protease family)
MKRDGGDLIAPMSEASSRSGEIRRIPQRDARTAAILAAACIALGCAALAARPPATIAALTVLGAIGIVGAIAPVPLRREARPAPAGWATVVGVGIAAFAAGRLLTAPVGPPATLVAIAATVMAAACEEIFFRRLAYGWLYQAGAFAGVIGTAGLFAVVHVPAYGVRALPLDLAAGIIFGWQRWATGGWLAPALTHATANLLQIL